MIAPLVLLVVLATPPADASFSPWVEKGGVAISIARMEKGPPWIRGTKTVAARCEAIESVLTGWESYAKTFSPVVKKATVLEKGDGFARVHVVWPYPWPLRARDAVVRYEVAREEGRVTIGWRGDAKVGDPKSGVRIDGVEGSTVLVPDGEACTVVYTYLGDLGGDFGKSSNEKAWKGQPPHYFESIEKALLARPK